MMAADARTVSDERMHKHSRGSKRAPPPSQRRATGEPSKMPTAKVLLKLRDEAPLVGRDSST